jgi:hypothetical protein
MNIDDFKDLVDLSNVSRAYIDIIKRGINADEELEDDFVIRFALMFTLGCGGEVELSPEVLAIMESAMRAAIVDPAEAEDELFRGGE